MTKIGAKRQKAEGTKGTRIAHCRASLADYKVPYTIHVLPELPKTGSGKVQKRDLRDRFSQPGAAARVGAPAPVAVEAVEDKKGDGSGGGGSKRKLKKTKKRKTKNIRK